MNKVLITYTTLLIIGVIALTTLTNGYFNFYNLNTGDSGITFILKPKVYDFFGQYGPIEDIQVLQNCWITFEVE